MRVLVLPIVAAAGLGAGVATAGDVKVSQPKLTSQPNPWEVAFGVELMSDYNWRGITISARRPAIEGYIEPRYRLGENLQVYAGVSGSSADLPNRSRAQIAYSAGIRPTFGALFLDVGGWYIDYPGGTMFNGLGSAGTCTNGAFFFGQCNTTKAVASYFEAYAKSVLTISEALAVGAIVYYAPSWANTGAPGTNGSLTAKVTLPNSMLPHDFGASLSGEIGRYWYGTTDPFSGVPAFPGGIKLPDYTNWNVGLTIAYKTVKLDLRYYDTNLSKADCNVLTGDPTATFGGPAAVTPINPSGLVSNWCSAAFVAKLTFEGGTRTNRLGDSGRLVR